MSLVGYLALESYHIHMSIGILYIMYRFLYINPSGLEIDMHSYIVRMHMNRISRVYTDLETV